MQNTLVLRGGGEGGLWKMKNEDLGEKLKRERKMGENCIKKGGKGL